MGTVDRQRIASIQRQELTRFADEHPRSRALFDAARASLVSGVPMTWMAKWVGGFPLYAASAHGAAVEDVDGHRYSWPASFAAGGSEGVRAESQRSARGPQLLKVLAGFRQTT